MKIDKSLQGKCGIYCIRNTKNQKMYVGSSRDMYYRLHRHKSDLRKNQHKNSHLQASFNKHRMDAFECFLLEETTENIRFDIEQCYLDSNLYIYNQSKTAHVVNLSPESRKKGADKLKEMYRTGEMKPTKTRKIKVFDLKGNLIHTFDTIKEASDVLKMYITCINKCLHKEQKQSHKMQFRYFEDNEPVLEVHFNEKTKTSRVYKVRKPYALKGRQNVKCYYIDTFTNKKFDFDSLRALRRALGIKQCTAKKYILSKQLYKKRYQICASLKSDELLEKP